MKFFLRTSLNAETESDKIAFCTLAGNAGSIACWLIISLRFIKLVFLASIRLLMKGDVPNSGLGRGRFIGIGPVIGSGIGIGFHDFFHRHHKSHDFIRNMRPRIVLDSLANVNSRGTDGILADTINTKD